MTNIKIGWDLDGVLVDIDVATLRLIDHIEDREERLFLEEWYYRDRNPLLNPKMFMSPEDRGFIITARPMYVYPITLSWCNHFFPYLELYNLPIKFTIEVLGNSGFDTWFQKIVKLKADAIKQLKIDLYIDDNIDIVRGLRARGIVAIQYGGRVAWEVE